MTVRLLGLLHTASSLEEFVRLCPFLLQQKPNEFRIGIKQLIIVCFRDAALT
jgi:hypothetical protein